MEKWDYTSRFWIDARKIRSLVQIAPITGQREIGGIVVAAMLSGNNMLDVKGRQRHRCLRQATVFAFLTGPATNEFSNGCVHQVAVCYSNILWALAWRMAIKSTASI